MGNGVITPVARSTRTTRGAPKSVNHSASGLKLNPRSWATGIANDLTTLCVAGSIWSTDLGSARTCQNDPSAKDEMLNGDRTGAVSRTEPVFAS